MKAEVIRAAHILWDYMQLGTKPGSAECLLVLGSRDDRVAYYAAELANTYTYASIVVTGGEAHHNDLLNTSWSAQTEADHFADIMHRTVDKPLLLEREATNTGENAVLSYRLLEREGLLPQTVQLVTKPYMERRAVATFEAQWPAAGTLFRVASPLCSFEAYINEAQPYDTVLNIMVGDFERILSYPARGYQTKQAVPDVVMNAFETLKLAGYTKHLPNKQ